MNKTKIDCYEIIKKEWSLCDFNSTNWLERDKCIIQYWTKISDCNKRFTYEDRLK
jgi:hypothetical protein